MRTKVKALPQHIIDKMDTEDRLRLGLKSTPERSMAIGMKSEADLQRAVEGYCVLRGFEKLTAENIQRADLHRDFPARGWQFHLSKLGVKRNPTMPDLTLFDVKSMRFLMLELKVPGGAVRPLQKILISVGFWKVAYSAEDAAAIIQKWFD